MQLRAASRHLGVAEQSRGSAPSTGCPSGDKAEATRRSSGALVDDLADPLFVDPLHLLGGDRQRDAEDWGHQSKEKARVSRCAMHNAAIRPVLRHVRGERAH
jgi:hypothetical protein